MDRLGFESVIDDLAQTARMNLEKEPPQHNLWVTCHAWRPFGIGFVAGNKADSPSGESAATGFILSAGLARVSLRAAVRGKKPQERAWGNLRSRFPRIPTHEFCRRAKKDDYLAPALIIVTKQGSVCRIGVADATILGTDVFAAKVLDVLRKESGVSYFILCDTYVSREPGQDKTDAVLLHGRHIDGRAVMKILPYGVNDGQVEVISGWEDLSDPIAGGAFSNLFEA